MLLGAQTYTIRSYTQCEGDFRESMKRIAAIGYQSVQLSAIGAIPARTLREVCDENGLRIVLTHTAPDRVLNDTENVIREHEIMGCGFVGLGSMPDRYRTVEWVDRFAADFTRPAEMLRDAGMKLMYHNHNLEWTKLSDGRTLWDVLLGQMPAELMGVTLDTYWVQAAGAGVLDWIEKLQDRIHCVHLKDMAVKGFEQRMAAVGEGNMDFSTILAKLQALGKTQYMLVEQDDCYGADPFACLKKSYDNIKEMGY